MRGECRTLRRLRRRRRRRRGSQTVPCERSGACLREPGHGSLRSRVHYVIAPDLITIRLSRRPRTVYPCP